MNDNKRRGGDRFDGKLLRNLDAMHVILPYLYPNRADNEAFVTEEVDLTNLEAYLEKKNQGLTQDKYTIMHAVAAAIVRTITLRPRMNRFIQGNRLYQRNHISLAFVVKKKFADTAEEALAFKKFGPETTIDTLHRGMVEEIGRCRSDTKDNSTNTIEKLTGLPRWILRIVFCIARKLDYYGKVPHSLIRSDPNFATVFITNLGSIKLNAMYHHLSNWGTCSLFLIIGRKHVGPVFHEDGTYDMRTLLPLGITLDERIADGYYYSKTVQIFKYLIQNPELLEQRADQEIEL